MSGEKRSGGGGNTSGGGGGLSQHDLMFRWASGAYDWGKLSDQEKQYIHDHVIGLAQDHPNLFNISPQQAADGAFWNQIGPQDLVQAANHNTSPTPGNTDGGGGQPPPEHGGGGGGQGGGGGGSGGGGGGGGSGGGGGGGAGLGKGTPHFPGVKGKDYHYVKAGGNIYVVYSLEYQKGQNISLGWRLSPDDAKGLGITNKDAKPITKQQFDNLQVFGSSDEISRSGTNAHPFQQWLGHLKEIYGNVPWLDDKEVVGMHLQAWAEKWTGAELSQALQQTKYYQGMTNAQRTWSEQSNAEQQTSVDNMVNSIRSNLDSIWGAGTPYQQQYDDGKLHDIAQKISSGVWGSPDQAMNSWLEDQRRKAQNFEGSAAWMQREQEIESQRQFVNRPEDQFVRIRTMAYQWLGPQGMPDDSTLKQWSQDLATNLKSEGDWQNHLETQAQNLYPFLSPGETWMDRASSYKRIAEQQLGAPISWEHPLLSNIGDGQGNPLSYDDFQKQVRSTNYFWGGSVAKDQSFDLLSVLNQTFGGVR